ncbi:gamma-glutamylcyclotransferase [Patescibacteria group bacterium]|nr:gamma-glutamylcyclotransferase [Patescibacteria group bacterium]MBU1844369.1 gamma-glutamylcyclotransferase [Patescibacteria group bacterium]
MNLKDLASWCESKGYEPIKPKSSIIGALKRYKLSFNYYSEGRKSSALNVMDDPSDFVCGAILELSKDDYDKIKEKEGSTLKPPKYIEIDVQVKVPGRIIKAKTFKANKQFERDFVRPTKEYLDIVLNGASKQGLDSECIEKIINASRGL